MIRLFDYLVNSVVKCGRSDVIPENSLKQNELLNLVDSVVSVFDPKVCRLSGYRRSLVPAVERTMSYVDKLINQLPPPIPIDPNSWITSPVVRILFGSQDQFNHFWKQSEELNRYFKKSANSTCYALLAMSCDEKKVLGGRIQGEIIMRDVLQTSVTFSDHRIIAPMASEGECRKELSKRVLSLLSSRAFEEIISLKEWKKELESERQRIKIKLKIDQAFKKDMTSLFTKTDHEEFKDVLTQLDQKIAEVTHLLEGPQKCLSHILNVLCHPEKHLFSETYQMRIDPMGIKITDPLSEKGHMIQFSEFSIGSNFKRAAILVCCSQ